LSCQIPAKQSAAAKLNVLERQWLLQWLIVVAALGQHFQQITVLYGALFCRDVRRSNLLHEECRGCAQNGQ
jgi:hypothetical protein